MPQRILFTDEAKHECHEFVEVNVLRTRGFKFCIVHYDYYIVFKWETFLIHRDLNLNPKPSLSTIRISKVCPFNTKRFSQIKFKERNG